MLNILGLVLTGSREVPRILVYGLPLHIIMLKNLFLIFCRVFQPIFIDIQAAVSLQILYFL